MNIVTHSGNFHADEVLAVATLKLVFKDKINVIRTRDEEKIRAADIAVDVGLEYDPQKKRFDHHQEGGAGVREETGIPYASFGLVWKEYGGELCESEEIVRRVDAELAQPIDAIDNGVSLAEDIVEGVSSYSFSRAVGRFNVQAREDADSDERFFKMVSFSKDLLEREIFIQTRRFYDEQYVTKVYNQAPDKRLIVLDRAASHKVLENFPEPLFVVKPSSYNTNWVVSVVRKDGDVFTHRKDLPKEWGGKPAEEIAKITDVDDVVFVHYALFIAAACSKEGALALANLALKHK